MTSWCRLNIGARRDAYVLPVTFARNKTGLTRNKPRRMPRHFASCNAEVSDRSQPSLTFDLSQAEPAGLDSLHRLVGLLFLLP